MPGISHFTEPHNSLYSENCAGQMAKWLNASALESLYCSQTTVSTLLIKLNICFHSPAPLFL